MNKFGLQTTDIEYLKKIFKQFPEIEEVIIFGSRAIGNHKNGSDIDLAIKGKKITSQIISQLHSILEEENTLPYFFDVLNYQSIDNQKVLEHIDQEGEVVFKGELENYQPTKGVAS